MTTLRLRTVRHPAPPAPPPATPGALLRRPMVKAEARVARKGN